MAKRSRPIYEHYCIDCEYSRDYHEKAHDGRLFLCKCDFQKRSMFLYKECCEKFKMRHDKA